MAVCVIVIPHGNRFIPLDLNSHDCGYVTLPESDNIWSPEYLVLLGLRPPASNISLILCRMNFVRIVIGKP